MSAPISRRKVLTGIGAAVLGGISTASVSAQADTDPYAQQPSTVTLTGYDDASDVLDQFKPLLVTRDLEATPTLYAWQAHSTERESTMLCYWAWYQTQRGLSRWDSHLGDREPIYVEVQNGEVQQVLYDAWHYLRNAASVTVPLEGDRPLLYVQSPHHFFKSTSELGRDVAIGDMRETYPSWHRNGWNVSREAVLDPWTMRTRGSWWPRDSTLGVSASAIRAGISRRASQLLGGAATETDEVA